MRLGQAYSVLVYMDLKCLNGYDETEQADPHTIMHMWKNHVFSRIRKGCHLQSSALVVLKHFEVPTFKHN